MQVDNPFDFKGEKEARALQTYLSSKISKRSGSTKFDLIAGVDVSYDIDKNLCIASAVLLDAKSLNVVEKTLIHSMPQIAYIPGFFSFLEGPPILEAITKLTTRPDLIVCDGHGIAHPRRLGLASHLGLALNIATIGCAKTKLIGSYTEPDINRGSKSELLDNGEIIGAVLRTQDAVKPVFVSIGHKISLEDACEQVLKLSPRYRLPETTRAADHAVRVAMKAKN